MTTLDLRQHLHQQVDQLSLAELQILVLLADRLLMAKNAANLTSQDIPGLSDLLHWLHNDPDDMNKADCTRAVDPTRKIPNLLSDLGWTSEQVAETYHRLQAFQTDWDAPGMEIYDQL